MGCLFDGGLVLGADTRATEGPIVADKNCEKVRTGTLQSLRCRLEGPVLLLRPQDAPLTRPRGLPPSAPRCLTSQQIHFISESIRCCGAGTAADTEAVTMMCSSNIALHQLSTGRQPKVATAMTMLKQFLFQCVPGQH